MRIIKGRGNEGWKKTKHKMAVRMKNRCEEWSRHTICRQTYGVCKYRARRFKIAK